MRHFRLYGVSEKAALREVLDSAAESWMREWLGDAVKADSRVTETTEPSKPATWRQASVGGTVLPFAMSTSVAQRVAGDAGWSNASGSDANSQTWNKTFIDAASALAQRIVMLASVKGSPEQRSSFPTEEPSSYSPEPAISSYASGYLLYVLTFGRETLSFVLEPEFVEKLLLPMRAAQSSRQKLPVASRMDAINKTVCRLEVVAGTTEITVEELSALSEGCVVRLDKKLGELFDLRDTEGQSVGKVYLAACGAQKALQLARS